MERKVEGKTVDVYVRLGTSAWSRRGEDARTLSFARQPAAIVRLGTEVVNDGLSVTKPNSRFDVFPLRRYACWAIGVATSALGAFHGALSIVRPQEPN